MKRNQFIFMGMLIFSMVLSACASPAPSSVPTMEATSAPKVSSPTYTQVEIAVPFATEAAPTPSTGITVTDALDRQVTLTAAPQRIVITGKALFMIADVAYTFPEAMQRIIGLGNAGQGSGNFIQLIDPNYDKKEVLAGDAGAEQIAALNPDLVILKSYLADKVGKPIEELKIPVIYVDFETPQQYVRDLAIFGEIFQDPARAKTIQDYYQKKVQQITSVVEKATNKPKVLLLYYTDKDGKVAFNVPPLEWIQTDMVKMAGGDVAWVDANPAKGWTQVTLEQIAAWNTDQIFIISYNKNPSDIVTELKADPAWQALSAVKNNHLYAFPGDLYSWDQPDVRWILGMTWLAGRLHPDLFPDLNMVAEVQKFYQTLYGLDEKFIEEKINPTFKGDLP